MCVFDHHWFFFFFQKLEGVCIVLGEIRPDPEAWQKLGCCSSMSPGLTSSKAKHALPMRTCTQTHVYTTCIHIYATCMHSQPHGSAEANTQSPPSADGLRCFVYPVTTPRSQSWWTSCLGHGAEAGRGPDRLSLPLSPLFGFLVAIKLLHSCAERFYHIT